MEQNNDVLSLDAIDLRILTILQSDASHSNQALAALVHVSPPTCLRRVKRLTDLGVIERHIAILSPDKLKALVGHGLTGVVGPEEVRAVDGGGVLLGQVLAHRLGLGPPQLGQWGVHPVAGGGGLRVGPLLLAVTDQDEHAGVGVVGEEGLVDRRRGSLRFGSGRFGHRAS